MKMLKLKKLIASTLVVASILALSPIGASAEWKKDNKGWWYSDGYSYPKEQWKQINGKWYYFDFFGYMISNGWMYEGYYLDQSGAWTQTSKYRREVILKNGIAHGQFGKVYYEAGDESNLKVINGEPCIFTMDYNDLARYIGMNTLNIYDIRGNQLDKVII